MEAASFKKTTGKWISVPIGNRQDDDLPPPSILDWRWVKYRQKDLDGCLFRGFASALHHIGELQLAEKVACATIKSLTLPGRQQLDQLTSVVMEHNANYVLTKYFKRNDADKLNVLEDISPLPTVVIPLGIDGGVAHAVTIIDRLIFDSTCERVLNLSKEALDWVCTNIKGYAKVYLAARWETANRKK